jgi:hypothetical protein
MAYNRQPQTVLAGMALKQNPLSSIIQPAGIIPVTLDVDIATTTSPGVVQVGRGLSITPGGILSATGGCGNNFVTVKLTDFSYSITADDSYVGATSNNITITLPLGVTGKLYYIKNQVNGNIKVKASGGQKIDSSSDKTLGTESSLTVIFDGSRWNVV